MPVKARKLFMGLVLFIGMFSMYNGVHADMNDRYGVQNNYTVSMQDDLDQLSDTVHSDNSTDKGLLERLRTLSNPTEDPFATIGAGLFLVPQLISLLTAPLDIFEGMVGDLQASLGFIPTGAWVILTLAFAVVLVFAMIEMYLRVNEA